MMKKVLVLAVGLGLASFGFGAETAPAGAVVGWWKFDDATNRGLDSSDYHNDLDGLSDVTPVAADTGYTTRGTYDDSGCLYIGTAGKTATATPKYVWDKTQGYTYLMRIRSGVSISTTGYDTQVDNLLNLISDNKSWHLISMRYDPAKVTGGDNKYYYWIFGDDPTVTAAMRCEASNDSASNVFFPLSTDIAIGGTVGAKGKVSFFSYDKTAAYKGYLDEVAVVCRTMTKTEVKRYWLTGDPNPYLTSDDDAAFGGSSGWSCGGENLTYGPHNLPGADFVVNNGRTLKALEAHAGATFGGHSLTLGHLTAIYARTNSMTLVAGVKGNLNQQVSVTISDLRLNNGKITGAAGQTLTATKLTVNAKEAKPYEINVESGTYAVTGTAIGGGWIKKTGSGTLDLTGLKGAFRVKNEAGEVLFADDYDYGNVPVLMAE